MRLVDARRLTGPNLLRPFPLVVVELAFDAGDDEAACEAVYREELGHVREAFGFTDALSFVVRPHRGGVVLGYEAPVDLMLACTEMSELAALRACAIHAKADPPTIDEKRGLIQGIIDRDRAPNMVALGREARARDLPFLWDDALVTVGAGKTARTFDRFAVPDPSTIQWSEIATVPIAAVTGTNGKTTSARLLARVVAESGRVVGQTSTEAIVIGGVVREEGDWTGPAAARVVLRDPAVEVAVLETARGGILRRGLAVDHSDVALITNVSDDHLGGYGIDDLDAMVAVKAVTARAVRPGGTVVLNAHDARLVALAGSLAFVSVILFADLERADDAAEVAVTAHRAAGGRAVVARAGTIQWYGGDGPGEDIVPIEAVPICYGGRARYNVENALGVAAAATALGVSTSAIASGLRAFTMADNPGRGQLADVRGVRVLLDFGHNPDGVRAVLGLVRRLREGSSGRLAIVTGSAGDRTDDEISDIARAIVEAGPDRVYIRELPHYLRGRAIGEVPRLFRAALAGHRLPEGAILEADSEVAALTAFFADARPGDFIAVLVHLEQRAVTELLDGLRA